MEGQEEGYGRPRILAMYSTNELRDNLSAIVNRAAFGMSPIIITRRGFKVAAVISIDDLYFLERMRDRRAAAMAEELPKDPELIGPAIARRLWRELFFG